MPASNRGVDFFGGDPMALADSLERLADNIRLVAAGIAPDITALGEAPFLGDWQRSLMAIPVITGKPVDQSEAEAPEWVCTGEIFAMSDTPEWVLTIDGFYLLGEAQPVN